MKLSNSPSLVYFSLIFPSNLIFSTNRSQDFTPCSCKYSSLFVASIGNWIGGLSSYLIGRIGSWNTIEKYLRVKRKNILLWKKKIDSWGGILAFLCWLPVLGDPIAIALGFFRTNVVIVAVFMLIGKFVRYLIWAMITYWGFSFL